MAEWRAGGNTVELAGCLRLSAGQAGIDVGAVYGVHGLKEERVCRAEGTGLVS